MSRGPVRELRLALTVEDYERVLAFYRDVLGLPVIESWDNPTGSGAILEAGRATLELLSVAQAELVDQVEVGDRVAGPVRIAQESLIASREAIQSAVDNGAFLNEPSGCSHSSTMAAYTAASCCTASTRKRSLSDVAVSTDFAVLPFASLMARTSNERTFESVNVRPRARARVSAS